MNRTGNQLRLTPAVAKRIVDSIEAGNPHEVACQSAGISRRTMTRYLERGRNAEKMISDAVALLPSEWLDELDEIERPDVRARRLLDAGEVPDRERQFWHLYQDIERARAASAERAMALIAEAGAGYEWTETRTETKQVLVKGQIETLTTTVTTTRYERDWKAEAWRLERTPGIKQLFTRATDVARFEISGTAGAPITVTDVRAQARQLVENELAAKRAQRAESAASSNGDGAHDETG